jgi:hypothetical protein
MMVTMVDGMAPGRTAGFAADGRFRDTVKFSFPSAMLSTTSRILMHCLSLAGGLKVAENGPGS